MSFIEATARLTEEELRKLLDLKPSQNIEDAKKLIDSKLPAGTDSILVTAWLVSDPRARADSSGHRLVEVHFRLTV